jgi:release factor glutamine methyltransferase
MAEVYEPSDDSFLLEKYVRKLSRGAVLDIGTGSGIQAMAAAERADSVTAVDISQEAIDICKKKYPNIIFLRSDLFSAFEGQKIKFDTIIFNAPYLPNDDIYKDKALDGGRKGYETIVRFLGQAKNFLAKDGLILLIFSSFTSKKKVDEEIIKNGFDLEELERTHISFEDIYCYKLALVR